MGMRYRVSPINPGESMTFTAEIEKDGSYVSGQAVTFSVTPDDGTVALSTTSGTTNSNGRASTTLSTGSNSSGSYRVTATLNNGQFISGTVTVGTPPPPRSLVIFLHHLGAVLPGGTVTFTAEVKEGGNSVQGQSVAFSVSPDDGTASLSTASTITDSVGQAQTMLVLGNDASGAYTITASINSLSVSSTVTVETVPIEPPTSQQQQLDLAIGSHLTPRGASVTVSVSQNGNPVADQTVRFSVTSDDGTALLSTTSTTTDSDGQASTTLSAGSGSAGPYKVTATLNNGQTSGTATVDTASPSPILEPTSLLIVSGDNQSGLISETLMTPFVVEVRDQYDAPLSEVAVTFVVLTGSGRLSNPTATTDANGQAASILRLGTETGINTVEVSVEGIPEIVTFSAVAELLEFDFSVPSGISLIHIPLRVRSVNGVAGAIESVADLYTVLGGAANVIYLVTRDTQTQEWIGYFGPSDTGTAADAELREDTGIVASLITSKELHLRGTPLGTNGNSTITLGPGINCVGIPLRDSRIMQVSDLFTLDGIAGNVSVIQLIVNGEFKSFGPTDAAADNIPIIGGQSLILIALRPATVAISGAGWTNAAGTGAAPSVTMTSLHVDDVTPILALSGSIANEGNELNQTGFRVIVKNRSTGKTVTAVAKSEYLSHSFKWGSDVDLSPDLIGGIGYRLAVVDMETGRAAMIGDTLEISVQSPHPRISVEPLEYTVTTEDVRQGWIQLPALGAYEIPAETALLHNYPNPFNPETWIPYRLAEDAFVKLTIYNSSGQVVRTLDMGYQTAAVYESQSKAAYWDGRNNLGETVASGVYFYTLTAGDFSATRKMLILK